MWREREVDVCVCVKGGIFRAQAFNTRKDEQETIQSYMFYIFPDICNIDTNAHIHTFTIPIFTHTHTHTLYGVAIIYSYVYVVWLYEYDQQSMPKANRGWILFFFERRSGRR